MARRITTFTDQYGNAMSIPLKIMGAWDPDAAEAELDMSAPRKSVPRKMGVEEIAGIIDSALEESKQTAVKHNREQERMTISLWLSEGCQRSNKSF
jgi:hypothetical protein